MINKKRYDIVIVLSVLQILFLLQLSCPSCGWAKERKKASNTCILCHTQLGKKTAEWVEQWRRSVHGESDVTCSGCHGGDPTSFNRPKTKDSGYVGAPSRRQVPEFCARCHSNSSWMRQFNKRTDQLSLYKTSVHGRRLLEEGDENVAICIDCHGRHDIKKYTDLESLTHHQKVAETCNHCHSDSEKMSPYDLRTDQLKLYKLSYHGQILYNKIPDKNPSLVPSCPECHGIHGAAPAGVTEVANVCGNCHTATNEYFSQSKHMEALIKQGKPRCIDCHAYHDILYPTSALFDGTEIYHCGNCHDVHQKEYNLGQKIKAAFVESEKRVNEVWEKVIQIEIDPGLDVLDERDDLETGKRMILEAVPVTHTLDLEEIEKYTNEILSTADKVEKSIDTRQEEFIIRKKGLFATLLILIIIIGFLLFKRWVLQLELELNED
ncbi:cytochrome c3 family protein [bacterium]|nr:cytochrome c3 family protein [bacterium]